MKKLTILLLSVIVISLLTLGFTAFNPKGSLEIEKTRLPIPASSYVYPYHDPVYKYASVNVTFEGTTHRYFHYNLAEQNQKPRLLIILLAGSKRSGSAMIDTWKSIADTYNLSLVAPDATGKNGNWDAHDMEFIRYIPGFIATQASVNLQKAMLFGHSAGAWATLAIAYQHPDSFYAYAAHGGALPKMPFFSFTRLLIPKDNAPVYFMIGTDDHIFPDEFVMKQAEAFKDIGYKVKLSLFEGHNHWYYTNARTINQRAYDFFTASD